MAKVKIGLALGGGAARGWAHIGVLKVLLDAGIVPDIVVGTSIGAVVGGCYVAGNLDEVEQFSLSLTRRRVFGFLDFNMTGSGLITGQRLCDRLASHLGDQSIEDLGTSFCAVATEIGTGHEIWLSRGRLVDAIRASYALPGIFRPVNINGRWLFDGALVNPVPVSVCRALGARYVIAVNLNADMCGRGAVVPHLGSEPEELVREGAEVEEDPKNGRAALKLVQRQLLGQGETAPGISRVVIEALNIVQDRIARSRLAGDPPDALINPKLAGIGPFDFHCARDLIEHGATATRRELEIIQHEIASRRSFEPRARSRG
jgi:NTE family protein